jgi:hypothetical protein
VQDFLLDEFCDEFGIDLIVDLEGSDPCRLPAAGNHLLLLGSRDRPKEMDDRERRIKERIDDVA